MGKSINSFESPQPHIAEHCAVSLLSQREATEQYCTVHSMVDKKMLSVKVTIKVEAMHHKMQHLVHKIAYLGL
jgi:hypothetical protein